MLILHIMSFGENLRTIRKQAGLTQVDLAKKAGVSQGVITHYENGIRTPKLDQALRIAKALEVSVEKIYGEKIRLNGKEPRKREHRNKRTIKIQEMFEKLSPAQQKSVFRLVKDLYKEPAK